MAAGVGMTLFAVNEALTTRLPLPQFLPSCRLAQLRLVHRVREVLAEDISLPEDSSELKSGNMVSFALDQDAIKKVTHHKALSWNAAAAGQMEIIEYLEELVELAKLLVGVNAFRSGMLEQPSYRQYVRRIMTKEMAQSQPDPDGYGNGSQEERAVFTSEPFSTTLSEATTSRRRATVAGIAFGRSTGGVFGEKYAAKAPLDKGAALEGEKAVDDLPPSLLRVGERMRQGRDYVRRMTVSEFKGKGVEQ